MLAHPLCLPHGSVLRPRATWSKRGWTRWGTEKDMAEDQLQHVASIAESGSLGHPN